MGKLGKFGSVSLLLSLCFYAWWLGWPALALYAPSALRDWLQGLFFGLPLWFWFSCILSFVLLFFATLCLLPESERDEGAGSDEQPAEKGLR